jgi:hypothetical protein
MGSFICGVCLHHFGGSFVMKIVCPHWSDCGVKGGGCCAIAKFGAKISYGVCNICLTGKALPAKTSPINPAIPRERWSLAARIIARAAKPGEHGIGDTLARLIGPPGEIWKRWYKRITGADCRCGDRQAKLNAMYPYA